MKKVVVFGGGTGLSCLLSGLKLFPIDVTTIIAVSDNGSSTGVLKEELDIPAVGDIGKVLLSMANVDDDFIDLLGYRFQKSGSLYNHPVRNILLAALIDLKGNLTEATKYMCKLLGVKGTVLPLTEERVELIGKSKDKEFFGEEEVSNNIRHIKRLTYDHDIRIGEEVISKIMDADLIIFSSGSLYTSVLPHLLSQEVLSAIEQTKAPLMYISNLVTQPGETDNYSVSQHIKVLNKYLKNRKIDMVVANNAKIDERIKEKYLTAENKTIVDLDRDKLNYQEVRIIEGDIFCIENDKIRHNALKTAFMIFTYLMENE
ncbi:MAG: YvcK family protein [Lachnospiraceae bacterium]|nr:YvcK family protein [Lachnospiraceae bacterium]